MIAAARALYWRPPDAGKLAGFGLTPADYPRPVVDLWPDNALAFHVFCRMATQWRTGFRGAIGLDYNVLPLILRVMRVPRNQWEIMLDSIQVMEDAALAAMNEG
ncbi:DUF1799 domain-containing protein [Cupriavidus plantarum]|uniref:DUF1799 domain-containing protein n=1 Tax=Cupriavidus plantarum TaxID=942865 RepID=UPI002877C6C0|nr:DUF1799 domain-containing protein [Cupriavidus plantarum]